MSNNSSVNGLDHPEQQGLSYFKIKRARKYLP